LPARNGPDLEDVPEEVRSKMTFTLAETIDDVLRVALGQDADQASMELSLAS
jgi:ATP-dependent Lon protease